MPADGRYLVAALVPVLLSACDRSPTAAVTAQTGTAGVQERTITFQNGDVTLAGTYLRPAMPGRVPGVVLFHGSGPQARDLDTARWFAAQGVAALAYDKRGVGQSTGDFRRVPFMDLTRDGLAGVEWLRQRADVDPSRVGVWGLSQGGWLGPLAASESNDVAFVIAVSGPGVSPGEQMVFYYENRLREADVADSTIRDITVLRRDAWQAAFTRQGIPAVRARIERLRPSVSNQQASAQLDDLIETLAHPDNDWIRNEMRYDPIVALRALHVPSLFVFGNEDTLVPVPESIDVIRRTLTTSHLADFTIRTIAGADHAMNVRPGASRQPRDQYEAAMRDWLNAHVLRPR
jgi:dienelactone hydrolase